MFFTSPLLLAALSYSVFLVEYGHAIAILLRRSLCLAIPVGLALHAAFYLMPPLNTYSVRMMVLSPLLLDPSAVALLSRLSTRPRPLASEPVAAIGYFEMRRGRPTVLRWLGRQPL